MPSVDIHAEFVVAAAKDFEPTHVGHKSPVPSGVVSGSALAVAGLSDAHDRLRRVIRVLLGDMACGGDVAPILRVSQMPSSSTRMKSAGSACRIVSHSPSNPASGSSCRALRRRRPSWNPTPTAYLQRDPPVGPRREYKYVPADARRRSISDASPVVPMVATLPHMGQSWADQLASVS
jgi:hypothetical protein